MLRTVKFERLSANAKTPVKATSGSCGYDLYSAYETTVPSKGSALVLTDIKIKLPKGIYARVASRLGLTLTHGINVGAGVIDPDYRGQIGVFLFNHGEKDLVIKPGDRCAQLIFEKYIYDAVLVEENISIDETGRGSGGFGSTGITEFKVEASQTQPHNLIIDNNAVPDSSM